MDSSSGDTLLECFHKSIIRRRKGAGLNDDYNLKVFHEYASKFEPDSRRLDYDILFKRNLEKFFLVPKQFDTVEKNELIAVFINFLLQLLRGTEFHNILNEQLRFLLMFLGDAPFLYKDHGILALNSLLAEVEAVANIAGSLVHSIFYKDLEFHTMEGSYGVLLERMALLKGNILQFLNFFMSIIDKSDNNKNSKENSSLFIVNSLIYDLKNIMNQNDSLLCDVKDKIKALHQEWMDSWSLLKIIMIPPPHSLKIQEHVTIHITEVAYETEYLINSFMARDAPICYFSMRLSHVFHKIKLIVTELREIKNNYKIGELKVEEENFTTSQLPTLQPKKRNYEVHDDIVVGFDDSVVDVLDKLEGGTNQLQITFIFGMSGLGKTTFAKMLYNHPTVKHSFHKRSWCVVSQIYQMKSLLIDILASSSSINLSLLQKDTDENLVLKIYQSLKGRRYLVVIDDVWDTNAWDYLRRCFPDDRNGSRIVITSRNKHVAPSNSIIYALPYLSNDQCLELLEKKVFKDKCCPSHLLGVAKKISASCHGLPLAVVVISGILCHADQKDSLEWEEVGEKVFSYSSCGENDSMMQIMELSYKHLPHYLKPCFLYFGVFPGDEEIPVKKLMQLWIAEGFILREESQKSLECLADKYLMELIDRSLVMIAKISSGGAVKACVIHNRLRDLSLKISKEENFLKLVINSMVPIYEKTHHLVQQSQDLELDDWTSMRSFFSLYLRSFHGHGFRSSSIFLDNMKLVRVLDFKVIHFWIEIEYLINLRYLFIDTMPPSIGKLVNLKFLRVHYPTKIPFLILKMEKLRYLYLNNGGHFDSDCNPSITNNLQVLYNVCIWHPKDEEILKCSSFLRKLKCECDAFYVKENEAYRYPDLLFFIHLESLNMQRGCHRNYHRIMEINFPSSIKKLNLKYLDLPLVNIWIIGWLPNLEVLKLKGQVFMGETWETIDGGFQQLKYLKLEDTNFKQWNVASSKHFPKLQQLVLHLCNKLEEFPCEIGEIPTLELIELVSCGEAMEQSTRRVEQKQREMGNEELEVIIRKNPISKSLEVQVKELAGCFNTLGRYSLLM